MRVRVNKNYSTPDLTAWPGDIIDVPGPSAHELVSRGFAVAIDRPQPTAEEPKRRVRKRKQVDESDNPQSPA